MSIVRKTLPLVRSCAALLALLAAVCSAQPMAQAPRAPELGQPGKDVVWVPTPERLIVRMLQMADTTSADLVIDLGSGDGRIPIAAAKRFGARGLGIEYDEALVQFSIRSARREGVAERVRFLREDLFQADLSGASVVALYVSPEIMLRLRPRLFALKPATRIVSHQFTLGDWEPDESATVEGRLAYLWVVPARVHGSWRLRLGADDYVLRLEQEYQKLSGSAEAAGMRTPVFGARLRGEAIRFMFVDRNGDPRAFEGEVKGEAMQGSVHMYQRPESAWSARRVP